MLTATLLRLVLREELMNHRSFIHDPAELIHEADIILQSNCDDHRFLKKIQAIRFSLMGKPNNQIAEEFDINLRTLQLWIKTADEKGFYALRTKAREGIKPKLSNEQFEELRGIVLTTFPFEQGDFDSLIWKDSILSAVIHKKYGISLSTRSCRTLLSKFEYRQNMSPYCSADWRFKRLYNELGAEKAWKRYKSWMDARFKVKGGL